MAKNELFTIKDFIEHDERYETRNIADETERCSIIFAMNKNIARQIPGGFDGLKPVARRALLTLYENRKSDGRYHKLAAVAGEVMAKYHPHNSDSIEDVIAKFGQSWANNIMYIDPSGNFGNLNGHGPASGRYISCKLSKFAYKCFFEDYRYASLDMRATYTGNDMEPEYLPARYPMGLINPQFSAIGWGTAANIAPFNLQEVLQAAIKLIDDPRDSIYLIPDFPSGCDIIADGNLDTINHEDGTGKITTIANYSIDHDNNVITINSLPHRVGSKQISEGIAKLCVTKMTDKILEVSDNTSQRNGVRIHIKLSKDANAEDVMKFLLKKDIGLKKIHGVQLKYIENYREEDYTPREYLLNWIRVRGELIQSMYNKKYVKVMADKHMNDIKMVLFNKDNIDKVISIVRKSNGGDDAVQKLMDTFKDINMTSVQAKAICDMKIADINKSAKKNFKEKNDLLMKEISECENVIHNPSCINSIIKEQMEEGIKLFGTPRRSKIIKASKDKIVKKKQVLVAITKSGYIKKVDYNSARTIGNLGVKQSEGIIIKKICNTKSILLLDSSGKVVRVPVVGIPDMKIEDEGVLAERYFKVSGNIVSVLEDFSSSTDAADKFELLLITKNGFAKRTPVSEFKSFKDSKTAITLYDGDELISVSMIDNTRLKDFIIYTNLGNGIRIKPDYFRTSSGSAKGKLVIRLIENESVVDIDMVGDKKYLFYTTSRGNCKITSMNDMPITTKRNDSLQLITLDKNEKLISIHAVNKSDVMKVYLKQTDLVQELPIANMTVATRIAKGSKAIRIPKGDTIVSVSKAVK